MIPKIIHICWFGNSLPEQLYKYIQTWIFYLWKDNYKIMIWDQSNISKYIDCDNIKFVLENKIYNQVSNYIRCKILYEYGGIYLDTDVEVIDNFDRILDLNTYIGLEHWDFNHLSEYKNDRLINDSRIDTGIMGFSKNHPLLLNFINNWQNLSQDYLIPNKWQIHMLLGELMAIHINNNVNYKIVNSIKEAKEMELNNILPIFNKPKFDKYDKVHKKYKDIQDYGICNHAFETLWAKK